VKESIAIAITQRAYHGQLCTDSENPVEDATVERKLSWVKVLQS